MRYTPKQIEKYNRQKYINQIDKITKNIFRMLRNNTELDTFRVKLNEMVNKLNELATIRLDTEYLNESHLYINRFFNKITQENFTQKDLEDIKDAEMSNLNRLQKMKNRTSYKKAKHKQKVANDGWE